MIKAYTVLISILLISFSCAKSDLGLNVLVEENTEVIETCRNISVSDYSIYDFPEEFCVESVYIEEFTSDANWWEGSQNGSRATLTNGVYKCSGGNDFNFYVRCRDCPIVENDNYQIELEIKINKYGNSCSINWGAKTLDSSWENIYRFGYSENKRYIIAHSFNGEGQDPIKSFTYSEFIQEYEFNKFTVRKIGNKHFFFINEHLVFEGDLVTYGPYFSIRFGGDSECEFDNLSLIRISK